MYSGNKDEAVRNLRAVAHDVKEHAMDAMEEAKGDVRATANRLGRKARNLYDSASENLNEASDTVTTAIRNKPVQSSVIALGIGLVLGALFKRR